jgi:peroxiredoxin
MARQVGPSSDEYLKDYLRYKTASLEMYTRTKSKEKLAAEYLQNVPILYENVEYMDFFHLYFEKYLLTNNSYMPYSKTLLLINEGSSLNEIIAEMHKDPILKDTRLAELVLISGLKEMTVAGGFKQDKVLSILDDIAGKSDFKEHRMIAKNLKERMLWMKPGTIAPDFNLPDMLGNLHKLSDYRGRYLFLSFISLNSPASLAEMNLLADIYPDYKHKIQFVSIVIDGLNTGWSQILKDYRMNWDILKAVDDIVLMEDYGATAPPVFILIDPEGNVFRYPAPSPSEDLRNILDSI